MNLTEIIAQLNQKQTEVRKIMMEAGEEVMKIYQAPSTMDVTVKSDTSPLTAADTKSHQLLTKGISELFPNWPILSEESAPEESKNRHTWEVSWLIDPLDGTKEFINRSDEFTLNLALIVNGVPQAGWVYAPAINELYQAIGQEACLVAGDQTQTIQTRALEKPPTLLMSRRHGTSLMAEAQKIFEAIYGGCNSISRGSSLKICEVAVGRADFYPRLGPTHEWDTAAAHAVLNAAGGKLVNMSGEPLSYNQNENSTLNPYFMAIGDTSHVDLTTLLSKLEALCKEEGLEK